MGQRPIQHMKKLLLFVIFIFLSILSIPQQTDASEKFRGVSAILATSTQSAEPVIVDRRAELLRSFLEKYKSPLAENAADFIGQADTYNLDWKLVAAISGTESTFGHEEPTACYNSWGFGIYTNHMTCFADYKEGIKTVSQALRTNYINRLGTDDVYAIGHMYAASPTWAAHTTYFLNQITQFALEHDNATLPISL